MTEDQCKKIQVATAARIYVFSMHFLGGLDGRSRKLKGGQNILAW